ncbi:NAD(P)H-binding protein [Ensifer sp. IC3342]|nr:NAD(P)H-binding protein [Ensifer sp. BRP08]MCA1450698.1 NAD(P)H-binding protein [Ensifer sp. IC3342]
MIVITAPTGNIGRQVLAKLLDCGEQIRVIARDPSKLPLEDRERVEVIEGSHIQPDVVMKAFDGADSIFWLVAADLRAPSAEAAYVDFARPALAAFEGLHGKRVVSVSALGRGWPQDAGHVTATLKMDDMIASTGVSYRALSCPSLMENMLGQLEPIKHQGVFFWPASGNFRAPVCATRDVADVAARLLLDRSWNGVEEIPLLGPEDLSCNDMATIMSEVLEKPIRFQEISMGDMRAMMISRGASAGIAEAMVNMLTAKNEGMDHMVKRTSSTSSPTSFREWCERVLRPAILT